MSFEDGYSRRDFLKGLLYGSGAAAAASSFVPTDAHGLDVSGVASLLSMDPLSLEYKVLGKCCKLCFTTRIVQHYQPIYMIEAIRGPGDSIFAGDMSKATARLH